MSQVRYGSAPHCLHPTLTRNTSLSCPSHRGNAAVRLPKTKGQSLRLQSPATNVWSQRPRSRHRRHATPVRLPPQIATLRRYDITHPPAHDHQLNSAQIVSHEPTSRPAHTIPSTYSIQAVSGVLNVHLHRPINRGIFRSANPRPRLLPSRELPLHLHLPPPRRQQNQFGALALPLRSTLLATEQRSRAKTRLKPYTIRNGCRQLPQPWPKPRSKAEATLWRPRATRRALTPVC